MKKKFICYFSKTDNYALEIEADNRDEAEKIGWERISTMSKEELNEIADKGYVEFNYADEIPDNN